MARRCILSYDASAGGAGDVVIVSMMERSYYDPTPGLPGTYLLDYNTR
jgi:hypothetical protein